MCGEGLLSHVSLLPSVKVQMLHLFLAALKKKPACCVKIEAAIFSQLHIAVSGAAGIRLESWVLVHFSVTWSINARCFKYLQRLGEDNK